MGTSSATVPPYILRWKVGDVVTQLYSSLPDLVDEVDVPMDEFVKVKIVSHIYSRTDE